MRRIIRIESSKFLPERSSKNNSSCWAKIFRLFCYNSIRKCQEIHWISSQEGCLIWFPDIYSYRLVGRAENWPFFLQFTSHKYTEEERKKIEERNEHFLAYFCLHEHVGRIIRMAKWEAWEKSTKRNIERERQAYNYNLMRDLFFSLAASLISFFIFRYFAWLTTQARLTTDTTYTQIQ